MSFQNSKYLVETNWLQEHLHDPDLRILDCTVYLPNYFEESSARKVEIVPGRQDYEQGHVPGSAYVDLVAELTDVNNKRFMFPMPSAKQFAETMSRHGVGEGMRVVLYDRMLNIWAARVWWMLRAFGFDHAAVLNGGWTKWTQEGRPVSTEPATYSPARFVPVPRPELIATKDEVLASIGTQQTCIVNALDADEYAGRGPVKYSRPGHIPSSVNVSFLGVVDPSTSTYHPEEELKRKFESVGALDRERVITYCGGGIAASSDAFVLTLLGATNVAVYDGSMTEWGADPSLPLETGDAQGVAR